MPSGVALELGLGEVIKVVESVGSELLAANECGEIVEMAECEYTSGFGAMVRWVCRAAFWIAGKLIPSG